MTRTTIDRLHPQIIRTLAEAIKLAETLNAGDTEGWTYTATDAGLVEIRDEEGFLVGSL